MDKRAWAVIIVLVLAVVGYFYYFTDVSLAPPSNTRTKLDTSSDVLQEECPADIASQCSCQEECKKVCPFAPDGSEVEDCNNPVGWGCVARESCSDIAAEHGVYLTDVFCCGGNCVDTFGQDQIPYTDDDENRACCGSGSYIPSETKACCGDSSIYNPKEKRCCDGSIRGYTCDIHEGCCNGNCVDPLKCETCGDYNNDGSNEWGFCPGLNNGVASCCEGSVSELQEIIPGQCYGAWESQCCGKDEAGSPLVCSKDATCCENAPGGCCPAGNTCDAGGNCCNLACAYTALEGSPVICCSAGEVGCGYGRCQQCLADSDCPSGKSCNCDTYFGNEIHCGCR